MTTVPSDRVPLLNSVPKQENNRPHDVYSIDEVAQEWPCAACGSLLGVVHLTMGVSLLIFDIVTNNTSETAFAVTAALSYIICAILSLIAARRLDKCAQLLLFAFAAFAALMSLSIFLESAVVLNRLCTEHECLEEKNMVHTVLIGLALTEFVVCLCTMFVCFRSLQNAFAVTSAASPYSTLIVGDYSTLERQPKKMSTRQQRNAV